MFFFLFTSLTASREADMKGDDPQSANAPSGAVARRLGGTNGKVGFTSTFRPPKAHKMATRSGGSV